MSVRMQMFAMQISANGATENTVPHLTLFLFTHVKLNNWTISLLHVFIG